MKKRLIKKSNLDTFDFRDLVIDYSNANVNPEDEGIRADSATNHEIEIISNGDIIAYMTFSSYENANARDIHDSNHSLPSGKVEYLLYVDRIFVNEEYRNLGVGQLLYKKFGEIYESQFSGWPVGRYYESSVAEYAFRKAISLGWISEVALDDSYVTRDRSSNHKKNPDVKWEDLRNKLPENVRGEENIW